MVRGAMDKETASMNPRAQALAVTLEKGAAALAEFAETSPEQRPGQLIRASYKSTRDERDPQ